MSKRHTPPRRGSAYIEKITDRYQIVVYVDALGVTHRRKVRHRDDKVLWDEVIEPVPSDGS